MLTIRTSGDQLTDDLINAIEELDETGPENACGSDWLANDGRDNFREAAT